MNNANEFYASILNNVREDAKAEERERIIKLLEQSLAEYPDAFATHIIALIKGENK